MSSTRTAKRHEARTQQFVDTELGALRVVQVARRRTDDFEIRELAEE